MAALPFGSANKQAPILNYPPRRVRYSVAGEHRRQMVLIWNGLPASTTVALGATRPMRPRPYSAPKVPQSSAQPNERLGRVPHVNHSSPLARFQGRKRRKAPEGFPKPTSRSAKRLSTRRRRTILPSRSPDFKGVNAGRPRVILLSDSAAAKRRGPAKGVIPGSDRSGRSVFRPFQLAIRHYPNVNKPPDLRKST